MLSIKKAIRGIGALFFWLTIFVVTILILEMALLSSAVTWDDARKILQPGSACYIVSDGVPQIKCAGFAWASSLQWILNVPALYIASIFLAPGMLFWFLTPYGRSSFSWGDTEDVTVIVLTVLIWLFIIPSVLYYGGHLLILLWHKFVKAPNNLI